MRGPLMRVGDTTGLASRASAGALFLTAVDLYRVLRKSGDPLYFCFEVAGGNRARTGA